MSSLKNLLILGAVSAFLAAVDAVGIETRTIDQLYQAALKEGGVVTVWHGGDEANQRANLKVNFENRFPGVTMNLTTDLSKYFDGRVDDQLAANNVYVDSIMFQTVHSFQRWKAQGALLNYKPLGYDTLFPEFKDSGGAFNGVYVFGWSNIWHKDFVTNPPKEYTDYLRPEFKDKLVLTYPNDDDAILYTFDLAIQKYGWAWFDALLAQNPRWVRGSATARGLVGTSNGTYIATFTSGIGLVPFGVFGISFPEQSEFATFSHTVAILKKAKHPEAAKLLHSWMLSTERQHNGQWSVRTDAPKPLNYPFVRNINNTNPAAFVPYMKDRAKLERFRFQIEDRIGTPQGLSSVRDAIPFPPIP